MLRKTALCVALLGATLAHANVLTTVKPLGFIASAITDGVTETEVLLPVSASPHSYQLKPSDVEKLRSAQLVVWIGDEMERFLESSIEKLPQANVLTLQEVEEIETLVETAEKDDHKAEAHDHHQHDHHHHHDEDWHIWLSPTASMTIAEQIAARLSQQIPEQKMKIEANLADFKQALAQKNSEITQQLSRVKGKGYYTFHDAYHHFESAYGLQSLGSFTINPTIAPGAKTLNNIKKNIKANHVQCLFAEPQFTPKVIESLRKNTQTHIGKLDPLGETIPMGKNAYLHFLQSLADQFTQCLK